MTDTTTLVAGQGPAGPRTAARPGLTLLALGIAGLVVSLQQTLVLPLLPRLMQTFDTSVSSVAWVFTATLLAGAVATPLLSRFGDMYGKKKMITATMALLVAGSVICALADSLTLMIVGRALQGAAAAVIPLAIGMIRDTFPRERVTTAIGVVSATMGVGGALGMLVTGVIADRTDTHHPVFWISAAMAALGLVFVLMFTTEAGKRTGGRPDLVGALVLAAWLVSLLLAVSQGNAWGWGDARIVGLFAAAVLLCALWVAVETHVREPLVRLRLLVGPKSLTANMASLLLGFAMFAAFTLVSNFIQTPEDQVGYGLSGSVLDVGLFMLPSTVTMLVFSALAGRFEARLGAAWTLATGSAVAGLAYVWLALNHDSAADVMIFSGVQGVGIGIAYAALGTLAVQHVPMDQSGIASGINSLVRTAGGSVASAATSAILASSVIGNTSVPTVDGYVLCFVLAGVAAGVTAIVAAVHGLRYRS
ncbi:MFS transporter [Streptomyces litchfieldiae]|uniref:MFS transporter n=1 Tax=Streptomyces litchfieldiae TaxID=3075543 RepID=A0ABU2MPN0_9ACTN|nr:MFS transporter [Streptomyces sp. DSM 44938]MDT0343571.1 MFS transporter [Streptomyces sp. DSM 44938]